MEINSYESFCSHLYVSRETYEKFKIYHETLFKWQNSINLISNSTLDNIWVRHFLDSGQLYRFTKNIRGNILTRFKKFIESDSDGFVVAKAAIDRLLNSDKKYFPDIENILRKQINQCLWNIVPLSINPSSPGQGALAIEIRADDSELKHLLKDLNNKIDYENVILEREELRKYGGGCHQKIGVSFQNTFFGKIKSSKGETDNGSSFEERTIYKKDKLVSKAASINDIFPKKLSEYNFFKRKVIENSKRELSLLRNKCIWI